MRDDLQDNRLRRASPKPLVHAAAAAAAATQDASDSKKAAQEGKLVATGRGFAILSYVAASEKPVDILDVATALKLPKATAYRLVDWFIGQGYLAREPGRKRLIVGPRLTALAFRILSSSVRSDVPHLILQRLVRHLNETCNIGTILNGEVVYLDRVEAEHWPLRLHYDPGSRVPLHCSAIGKLFLALTPPASRQRLLRSLDLRRHTSNTITERARLEAELQQIKKEQVSFDRQEFLLGVFCMAVPVIGADGRICAAIAVQAPEARMNAEAARAQLPALRRAALELGEFFRARN
jgi:DNA-binding IclR family transcriptional regulator